MELDNIASQLVHLNISFSCTDIATWVLKDKVSDEAIATVASFVDAMVAKADEKAAETLLRLSRIPQKVPKLFSNFDMTLLAKDSRSSVDLLRTLSFIPACRNIIMVGPTGTGKTHLAQAIGNECCKRRIKTYFVKMQELKEKIAYSLKVGSSGSLISTYQKYQCLIIDEVGYCSFNDEETRVFFQIVDGLSSRDSGSIVLTSNKDVDLWSEFFSDMDALECTLDRLCDNALCISFSGDSYRGKGRTSISLDFNNPLIAIGN